MKPKRFYGQGLPGVDVSQLGGALIVVEGADGSGRSTQIAVLKDWLERRGHAIENVGLSRSTLVSKELDKAKSGNVMGNRTFNLFYATDLADQLENKILPALRAGFSVLADRYIYTLMARGIVRGLEREWIESIYNIALVPDLVFYLRVRPQVLIERNFQKNLTLDYWETGMDTGLSNDMFESFFKYQRLMQNEFKRMENVYDFKVVNGNRTMQSVSRDLQTHIEEFLQQYESGAGK